MNINNDKAGITSIPGTPKNLTKGTESNGYSTLVEYSS
jgi:hypothetical protein